MRSGQLPATDPSQGSQSLPLQPVPQNHGAAFASYGSVPRSRLRILRGTCSIKAFASSPTVVREFCAECGSTLFWSRSQGDFADWVSIALGTLDTPFLPKKQKHVHVDFAAPWYCPHLHTLATPSHPQHDQDNP